MGFTMHEEKNASTSQCRMWNSSMCKNVKLDQLIRKEITRASSLLVLILVYFN